jgi:hypothetical protein
LLTAIRKRFTLTFLSQTEYFTLQGLNFITMFNNFPWLKQIWNFKKKRNCLLWLFSSYGHFLPDSEFPLLRMKEPVSLQVWTKQNWWCISKSNLRPTLEIYALRPPFLYKFTVIWHHAFGPCAQLIAFSLRFGCAQCHAINFFEIHPGFKQGLRLWDRTVLFNKM